MAVSLPLPISITSDTSVTRTWHSTPSAPPPTTLAIPLRLPTPLPSYPRHVTLTSATPSRTSPALDRQPPPCAVHLCSFSVQWPHPITPPSRPYPVFLPRSVWLEKPLGLPNLPNPSQASLAPWCLSPLPAPGRHNLSSFNPTPRRHPCSPAPSPLPPESVHTLASTRQYLV